MLDENKIAIVIPLYNDAPNIERAIRSAVEQKVPDTIAVEVIVVDEVNLNFLDYNRSEQAAFERYVNYGVSHKSLMMIVIVQDMRNLSPCVKRSADYLLLYPSFNNYDVLYDLRRKTGHNYVELMKLCGPKDNITSAFNNVGPPLRRNIFEVININDDADSD